MNSVMTHAAAAPHSTQEKLARARDAAPRVARLGSEEKNGILRAMAAVIAGNAESILEANRADLAAKDLRPSSRDRLLLNPKRMGEMLDGIQAVIRLPDPVGEILEQWTRPDGLEIRKVRVPLGVIGVIYESRPNVTVDAVVLAFKAGNAVVLRGGREAAHTNECLVDILCRASGLPEGSIELLDSSSRDSVDELLRARGLVDVIVPRGGADLINRVVDTARVPVIETGAGNCHVYVDEDADLDVADRIVINAKVQRPSVCNSAEKLLVHRGIAAAYVPRIVRKLQEAGVEVRGDEETRRLAAGLDVRAALPEDWFTEYSALIMAVAVVDDLDAAIGHIRRFSTSHSEAIVTRDEQRGREFLERVDSAAVYWNASTRFTDGGEFGFGAEMGISTQKLHCRGPFGLKELTSIKYQVVGSGQIRS
ncbi:MAG TPA: glutamate-5-semialdehyde dehydrogenase [Terriglobia bacterium]|jgi:glutamate-5-semialdehyde dehydrogenase|nr:glutamate-5-semialdehyde dehydrogenase [Terriglobia bacterium]